MERLTKLIPSVLFAAIVLAGCYTPRKAQRQMAHIAASHPDIAEKWCAMAYGSGVEVADTLVVYKEGRPVYQYDTVSLWLHDTVAGKITTRRVAVPCPEAGFRVDTFRVNTKTVEVNSAAIDTANRRAAVLQAKAIEEADKGRLWRRVAIFLAGLIIGYVGVRLILSKL